MEAKVPNLAACRDSVTIKHDLARKAQRSQPQKIRAIYDCVLMGLLLTQALVFTAIAYVCFTQSDLGGAHTHTAGAVTENPGSLQAVQEVHHAGRNSGKH